MVEISSNKPKGVIIPDPNLARLCKKTKVTEADLLPCLQQYDLIDALHTLGVASSTFDKWGEAVHFDKATGFYFGQYVLAYFTSMLILSYGIDEQGYRLGDNSDNVKALVWLYDNALADPFREAANDETHIDSAYSWIVRTAFEQMSFQFVRNYLIARNLVLFCDLSNQLSSDNLGSFNEVFSQQTGLPIAEFLKIAFIVYVGLITNPPFVNTTSYTMADIPGLKVDLCGERVMSFINVLQGDYNRFRNDDSLKNRDLNKEFTKYRYNPLFRFPIVKPDANIIGKMFVVPNTPIYVLRAFGGLFWWFDDYYKERQLQDEYRQHFGKVLFEDYVGIILKGIYGERSVVKGSSLPYGSKKCRVSEFGDWFVVRQGKLYLFEVKAVQFSLLSRQTGDKCRIVQEEIPRMTKAIKQLFRRVSNIETYEELKQFRGLKVVPIAVFYDVPTPLERALNDWIKADLREAENENGLAGISKFQYHYLDIKQLELYDGCADLIDLDEALSDLSAADNFRDKLIEKRKGGLKNRLLDRRLDEFFDTIIEPQFRNVK